MQNRNYRFYLVYVGLDAKQITRVSRTSPYYSSQLITYSPSMHNAHRFEDNSLVVRYVAAYAIQLIEDGVFFVCLCKKADKLLRR
jgi:hypothetical protein